MLYTLKFEGKKYAYDSASGAVLPINTLWMKMLDAIIPPVTPTSLTSLRYELAKFDSGDVSDAFDSIYALAQDKVLYAADDGIVRLAASGDYACEDDALAAFLLEKAFTDKQTLAFETVGNGDFHALAADVAKRLGKTLA